MGPGGPGGGNWKPAGGEPDGAPFGGGKPGGIALGIPGDMVRISATCLRLSSSTYQEVGNWAFLELQRTLEVVFVGEAAFLSSISILRSIIVIHVSI